MSDVFALMVKQLAKGPRIKKKRSGRPSVLPLATRKRIHTAIQEGRFGGNRRMIASQFGVARYHVENIAAKGQP